MSNRDFTKLAMKMTSDGVTSYFKHVPAPQYICENCGVSSSDTNKVYECQDFRDMELTDRDDQSGGDQSYCSNCLEGMLNLEDEWAEGVQVTWYGLVQPSAPKELNADIELIDGELEGWDIMLKVVTNGLGKAAVVFQSNVVAIGPDEDMQSLASWLHDYMIEE